MSHPLQPAFCFIKLKTRRGLQLQSPTPNSGAHSVRQLIPRGPRVAFRVSPHGRGASCKSYGQCAEHHGEAWGGLDRHGEVWRSLGKLGEAWKQFREIGETRGSLGKPAKVMAGLEKLCEAQEILKKLGEAWRSLETVSRCLESYGEA